MRVPRVRLSLRRMMAAVAVVAVLMACVKPGQRFLYCLRWAYDYRVAQANYLAHIRQFEIWAAIRGTTLREVERQEREGREAAARAGQFVCGTNSLSSLQQHLEEAVRNERAYLRAAFHPWEPTPGELHAPELQRLKKELLKQLQDEAATTGQGP